VYRIILKVTFPPTLFHRGRPDVDVGPGQVFMHHTLKKQLNTHTF